MCICVCAFVSLLFSVCQHFVIIRVRFDFHGFVGVSTYSVMCRAVIGMLTVGNMMSMVTKGKVDVSDTVEKVIYRQFKQVWSVDLFLYNVHKKNVHMTNCVLQHCFEVHF